VAPPLPDRARRGPPRWIGPGHELQTIALRRIERFIAIDYEEVRRNHAALAELAKCEAVTVFSAHDPEEYERLRAASAG
jgi:hypothetical protein